MPYLCAADKGSAFTSVDHRRSDCRRFPGLSYFTDREVECACGPTVRDAASAFVSLHCACELNHFKRHTLSSASLPVWDCVKERESSVGLLHLLADLQQLSENSSHEDYEQVRHESSSETMASFVFLILLRDFN